MRSNQNRKGTEVGFIGGTRERNLRRIPWPKSQRIRGAWIPTTSLVMPSSPLEPKTLSLCWELTKQNASSPRSSCERCGRSANRAEPWRKARGANPEATLPIDGKSKAGQLAKAGIVTSTANRFEQLAGPGRTSPRGARAAADTYFVSRFQTLHRASCLPVFRPTRKTILAGRSIRKSLSHR